MIIFYIEILLLIILMLGIIIKSKRKLLKYIFCALFVLMLVINTWYMRSCSIYNNYVVKDNAKKWSKYLEKKDVDGLYKIFCDDIKNNYADKTKEEIRQAFEFIDGNIISCKYRGIWGEGQAKDDYKTNLYFCYPEYLIETSEHKTYWLQFSYTYICDQHKEYEGVHIIRIINYKGDNYYEGEEVSIGKAYDMKFMNNF